MVKPGGRPVLDVGDRVRLRVNLGGFFRPHVRRGSVGIVVARADHGLLAVRFHDYTELIDPRDLADPG